MDTGKTETADILLKEFGKRKARNGSYSLRAYARYLGISPASLSQVLSGKRPLGVRNARKIIERLDLTPSDSRKIIGGIASGHQTSTETNQQISYEAFQSIADWYHFAILSLGETKGSKADPHWISKRLGIPPNKAKEALKRLEQLELIKCSRGTYRQTGKLLKTSEDIANAAIRSHHRAQLEKGLDALFHTPVEQRTLSSSTFAIKASDLCEAKAMLIDFRTEFLKRFGNHGGPRTADRVYALNTQLIPLDKDL